MREILTQAQWLKSYNTLNNSFIDKLVFRIGVDAGFFSEYNNMVLALLYCLKYKIRFVLYSRNANFALDKGWTDFFKPFVTETNSKYNSIYNLRPYQVVTSYKQLFCTNFYKILSGTKYFTQDLFDKFHKKDFSNEIFNIPELGIVNATILEATQIIISNIWKYNYESQLKINELKNNISFSDKYISMHIRSGDKFLESELFNINQYMTLANSLILNKKAFILTDDYTVIEQLELNYPDWEFKTLCDITERGYFHQDFIRHTKKYRYEQHLKLFASMDICAEAEKFIGTYSSNPGMYMGMRIGSEKCKCLDFDSWVIW